MSSRIPVVQMGAISVMCPTHVLSLGKMLVLPDGFQTKVHPRCFARITPKVG